MTAPYTRDAIQQALEEGCTGKTRALAQAYLALRMTGHYTSREQGVSDANGGDTMTTNDDHINEAIAEVLRLEREHRDGANGCIRRAAEHQLAAAAPVLAREVQRLQAEAERLRGPHRHCYHCLEDLPQGATDDCCDGCRDQLRRDEEVEP